MTPIRFTLQSTALLLPVILGGCVQSSVYVGEIAPLDQGIAIADGERGKTYTVNAGDDLTVRFYYNPQLDEDVRVRPDGSISLSLIGEIPAAGKTPAELSEQITSNYAEFLTKPKAVVIMRNFARARAFVAGEVFRPGMLSLAQGFILISIFFSAIMAKVIDRDWRAAGVWCLIAAAPSACGIIHGFVFTPDGYAPAYFKWSGLGGAIPSGLDFAVIYLAMAVLLFGMAVWKPREIEH